MGLTWIEHIEPQSAAPDLVHVYSNCAYACQRCNRARGTHPTHHSSRARLLNPWRDIWGEHFQLQNDRLVPRHDGPDGLHARYTIQVYRLNEPRKVGQRQRRREFIDDQARLFADDVEAIRATAMQLPDTYAPVRRKLIEHANLLEHLREQAVRELRRYRPVPADAPMTCRCGHSEHHQLPGFLAEIAIRPAPATPAPPSA